MVCMPGIALPYPAPHATMHKRLSSNQVHCPQGNGADALLQLAKRMEIRFKDRMGTADTHLLIGTLNLDRQSGPGSKASSLELPPQH